MDKKVFSSKLTPVPLREKVIWSQNCPFDVFLWWNKNGDPLFILLLCFLLITATHKIYLKEKNFG